MKTMATVPVRDREERDPGLDEKLRKIRQDVIEITEFAKALSWWVKEGDLEKTDPDSDVLIALGECRFLVNVGSQLFADLSQQNDGEAADWTNWTPSEDM